MARALDRGTTLANQQQGREGRTQATRKGPVPRDAQPAGRSGSRGRPAAGTATRAGASAKGQVTAARQNGPPAGRPPRPGARRPASTPDRRRSAAARPARGPWTPGWIPIAALLLSLVGLGLGIYLTIAHLVGTHLLACPNTGFIDCAAVTTSPESKVFGVFPVAELGLGFFFAMTVLNLPWAWRPTWSWLPRRLTAGRPGVESRLPVLAWRMRLAGIVVGIGFVLYLIYTELITLRQICLFCTYTHITTFLLFVLLIVQGAFWGSPAKAPDSAAR
jgi:uncharacterized membrane protein